MYGGHVLINLVIISYSLFLLDMCLSPHVVHKGKQEISVGEAHCDNRMEFDRENHEIQEVMDQEPRRPKLDRNGSEGGPHGLLHGPAGPALGHLTSCFIHGQV